MEVLRVIGPEYDKAKEVKAFDDTKAGVKGLVDSGVTKIPKFFIHPPENVKGSKTVQESGDDIGLQVPVVDLARCETCRREVVVDEIRQASQTWGSFQMVNHGIPVNVLDEMLAAVRRFHEQSPEEKMKMYSRDRDKRVRYFSNGNLLISTSPADWRDTLVLEVKDSTIEPELIPEICREAASEYIKQVIKLSKIVAGLISEAIGVDRDYLSSLECMETESLTCHYYPPCPEPDLTLGASKHTDPTFVTILLQDNKGGFQVLVQDQWIDVNPVPGALLVNIGDFIQLISNDKFKSVEHRVLVGGDGARTSVACHFYPSTANTYRPYGPIKEVLDEKQPLYRETHLGEFIACFRTRGLHGNSTLAQFKLASDS